MRNTVSVGLVAGVGIACAANASHDARRGATDLFAPSAVEQCLRPGAWQSPIAVCFAEGTNPRYMEVFMQWVHVGPLRSGGADYNTGGRWDNTSFGLTGPRPDPVSLTFSFPSDNLGGIGGGQTTQNVLNARMVQWFGSVQAGRDLVRSVFARWGELSGLRYFEVSDDDAAWGASGGQTRGDVRIVSINIDGPGNVLAFNFFPNVGDMVIDSSDGFGGSANNFRFFRNTVSHEAGHGWGAAHVCPQNGTKLMEPGLNTGFDGPQHDDVRGANFNYGDALENNDTSATATNTLLTAGAVTIPNLSIDQATDSDWFRLNLPAAGPLTLRATPHGFTYNSTPQGADCPPPPHASVNSQTSDLAIEVYAANGTTLLTTANATGVGSAETLTAFPLPSGGTYFVRVFAASQVDPRPQLYTFEVTHVAGGCPGDANGDGMVNFVDLNFVLANFGASGPQVLGDVNADGTVNFQDLNIVLSNFGVVC